MSAIAGIFSLEGRPVERPALERMVGSVAHRGPDGAGVWSEGPLGLGHRMLHTTPESLHERLPLVNKTGDLALTADARIDNRDELIALLGLTDRTRAEITDSELILRAYERWGERSPERLLGDFAFAVWDRRRQELFCARDHMGIKPFYYYWSGRALIFASEIKALLRLREVPRRLNEVMVAYYLVPLLEDKSITFYREIFRLPPAHRLSVGRSGARMEPYWSLNPHREVRYSSDEEYAEAFREVFTEAVHCRLRSAFQVGSNLSGGLDSSSISCVARKLLSPDGERRLRTFSAIFDEVPECDERPFIDAVLAGGDLDPHYVHADQLSPLSDFERVMHHMDEPFLAPHLFMHWALCSAAHQQDVRVLLNGTDGDTTVSHGLAYLTELARRGRWRTLATETNALSRRHGRSPRRTLLEYGIKPLTPEPVHLAWRLLRGRKGPAWAAGTTINSDFAQRIGLAHRVKALNGNRLRPALTAREHHWRKLTTGIFPFGFEGADRVAAAFSIEFRYPFFDKRLVEFCLGLPPEQKLYQGWTRMIMRRAMSNILPVEVQWREGKSNLAPNFKRGLLTFEQERLEEVILDNPQVIEEYVDVPALRKAYNRFVLGSMDEDAMAVWKATTLALGLRQTGLIP